MLSIMHGKAKLRGEKKNILFVLKPGNWHIFCSPAIKCYPSDFLPFYDKIHLSHLPFYCGIWAERSLLLTGMWRHLFSEVLQSIIRSSLRISDSIRAASHSLSNYESSARLIYNSSLSSRLCSRVKSFLTIICQRRFLVNSFDEHANSVCFNIITKMEGFLLWEKPKSTKKIMSRLPLYFCCQSCK